MLIDEIGLSVRAYNCLRRAGVRTIEEMAEIAKTDLNKIRNCGEKTKEEILNAVANAESQGFFSEEYKTAESENNRKAIRINYILSLGLSVRAKTVLIRMGVGTAAELLELTEEKLYAVRNAGTTTVKEIMYFINVNKAKLMEENVDEEVIMARMDIAKYTNLCGAFKVCDLPLSLRLKTGT
ncbi:MAG: hypothetical protein IKL68_00910 [Clostridia bacterium]|nr:hypothetical protein [Clostridia bacterium]